MSLNNFFLCKKKKEAQQEEEKKYDAIPLSLSYEAVQKVQADKHQKRVQLTAARQHRLENFCDTMFSQQYIQSMEKGSIPLKHPINHDFRDRERKLEMDKTGGITVKT